MLYCSLALKTLRHKPPLTAWSTIWMILALLLKLGLMLSGKLTRRGTLVHHHSKVVRSINKFP